MNNTKNKDEKIRSFLDSEKLFMDVLGKIDVEEGWNRFSKQIDGGKKISLGTLYSWRSLAVAASLALLVTLGVSLYYMVIQPNTEQLQLSATEHNAALELGDGSMIYLKEGSVLEYPQKFRNNSREVMLSGEAYFDIVHDKDAPFSVHVGKHKVKVLGTSFNINQEEEVITVSVITGKVSLTGEGGEENGMVLQAGDKGTVLLSEDIYQKQHITSQNFLYWKTRKLSYSKVELGNVFNEVASCFGVEIIAEDPVILQYKLTTTFDDQKLDEILDELGFLFDLEFITKADSIFVRKRMQ